VSGEDDAAAARAGRGDGVTGGETAAGEASVSDAPGSEPSAGSGPNRANRRRWTAVIFASLAIGGGAMMARGPVIPELGTAFGAPAWQLGLIAPAGTLGYLFAVTVVGFGAGHLRARLLIAGGLLGNALALLVLGAAPVLLVFLAAVTIQGAMMGVVRGLNRPLLSHFYPSRRGRVYSYYDMTWAIGATSAPLLVVAVVWFASWRLVFWLFAVLMLGLAVLVWRFDEPAVETQEEPLAREDVRALLRRPEVLGMALVMFFATGVEGGLFLWLPTYAESELPGWIAGATLSIMLAGYVPGRFVYGRLSERVGYVRIIVAILGLLVPVFVLTFVVADGLWVLPGILAIGLLISGAFPMLVSYATDAAPEYSGPVTAVAAISSSLGVGMMPAVMGFAISGSDPVLGMQLLLLPLGMALLLIVAARIAEVRRAPAEPVSASD